MIFRVRRSNFHASLLPPSKEAVKPSLIHYFLNQPQPSLNSRERALYGDPEIHYLWLQVERYLENVDEIVVIGYSLPPTDFASKTLLRRGTHRKARLQMSVTVVDIDERVKDRFSRIFNPHSARSISNIHVNCLNPLVNNLGHDKRA